MWFILISWYIYYVPSLEHVSCTSEPVVNNQCYWLLIPWFVYVDTQTGGKKILELGNLNRNITECSLLSHQVFTPLLKCASFKSFFSLLTNCSDVEYSCEDYCHLVRQPYLIISIFRYLFNSCCFISIYVNLCYRYYQILKLLKMHTVQNIKENKSLKWRKCISPNFCLPR